MKSSEHAIRSTLRSPLHNDSGLTINQLANITGVSRATVKKRVAKMSDTYVSGWVYPSKGPGRPAAIYRAVYVPPDCPPPPKHADSIRRNKPSGAQT